MADDLPRSKRKSAGASRPPGRCRSRNTWRCASPIPSTATTSTRDPLGAAGDFITAPEISQMFGELIGLWAAAVWRQMGAPENVRLVELGPGRGTMMLDALRAAQVVPEFRAALVVHLVEISPALEQRQRQALARRRRAGRLARRARRGAGRPGDHPRQRILRRAAGASGGHVRRRLARARGRDRRRRQLAVQHRARPDPAVRPDAAARACATAQIGEIFEWRADQIALELGRRVARAGGAALVIDYGHAAERDRRHAAGGRRARLSPIRWPRRAWSISPRMSISRRSRRRPKAWARARTGRSTQGEFLRRLGIDSARRRAASAARRRQGAPRSTPRSSA